MTTKIFMLQAGNGDCFIVEFMVEGDRIFRLLVDGGPQSAYASLSSYFSGLGVESRYIDLLVVTHIDEDHIGGVLSLLNDEGLKVSVHEIWFNDIEKAKHPDGSQVEKYHSGHGIELVKLINKLNIPWNARAGGRAICLDKEHKPVSHNLGPTASITVLSPSRDDLKNLVQTWSSYEEMLRREQEEVAGQRVEKFSGPERNWNKLAETRFIGDTSVANLSSIAFILRVADVTMFFSGDAGVDTVNKALDNWPKRPKEISVFKVSHHGSSKNTDEVLLKKLPARHYLFAANGKHHHPSLETIARIVSFAKSPASLHFNHDHLRVDIESQGFIAFARAWKAFFYTKQIIKIDL